MLDSNSSSNSSEQPEGSLSAEKMQQVFTEAEKSFTMWAKAAIDSALSLHVEHHEDLGANTCNEALDECEGQLHYGSPRAYRMREFHNED